MSCDSLTVIVRSLILS